MKNKLHFLLSALLFFLPSLQTNAQGWLWGRGTAASIGNSIEGWAVAADASGNVFAAGLQASPLFSGYDTFGTTVVLPTTLATNCVWVKYDASGKVLWADCARGGYAFLLNIATDPSGNLIIFGTYNSPTIQIGPFTLTNIYTGLISQYFLAKISPSGTVLWAVSDGSVKEYDGYNGLGAIFEQDGGVTTDSAGNIYITGPYNIKSMNIGPYTLTNADITGVTYDVFVAKYDPSGSVDWALSMGGTKDDYGMGITVSSTGYLYVAGSFSSPSFTVGSSVISDPYTQPIAYIAKFSTAGVPLWAQSAGGSNGAFASQLVHDNSGNVYMTGGFADASISFGSTTMTRTYPAAVPKPAQYVAQYSPTDVVTWSKTIGSPTQPVDGFSVAVTPCGQVWVSGSYTEAAVIAPGDTLAVVPGYDPSFLAGYNISGGVAGYVSLASGGEDQNEIASDASGNIYTCGDFYPSHTLSFLYTSLAIGPDTLHGNLAGEYFYLGKYSTNPLPDTIYASSIDTVPCTGVPLSAPAGYTSYYWDDSATTPTRSVTASGKYYVYCSRSVSCSRDTILVDTFNVTMLAVPSVITGPGRLCAGNTTTLSDTVTGGAWNSSNTTVATVNAVTGTVTGVAAGIATISYSAGAGCAGAYKTITVTAGVPPITGVANMCAGGATMYVADADTPYGWWTSTFVTITTKGLVTTYDTGVGTITYTMPDGCYATASLTVTVLPDPIAGISTVCTGYTTMLTDTISGGAWSISGGGIASISGAGVVRGIAAGKATVTYVMPTGCMRTDSITVYPSPPAITGGTNVCIGMTTALSDTASGGAWSERGGIASVDAGTGVVKGVAAGTTTITYTTAEGCIADRAVTVLPVPGIYGVTGGGSICAGATGAHVLLSGSATGINYKLYDSGVVTDSIDGTGAVLDFGAQTTAGTYKVVATNMANGCDNNMADSALIIVNPLLKPSVSIAATPPDTICAGAVITLTATPVNGGPTPAYQWKVNGVNAGAGSSSYSFAPANGDVVVMTLTSDAVCAAPPTADTFMLMMVETPVIPTVAITADPGMNISKGGSVTFTAVVTNGGTSPVYEWEVNGTAVPGGNTATLTVNDITVNETVSCKVTGSGICSEQGSSNGIYVTTDATGVKPQTTEGELTVVPNPTSGAFIVSGWVGSINDEEVSLEITDMLGQVVYISKVTAINGNINERIQLCSDIASGMYLLNVRCGSGVKVFHVVME